MEKFADCIPEFPRRSPGIFTLHHKLISMKARLEEYGRRLRRLPSKAESWEGSARSAFDRALAGEVRQTGRLNEGLEEGARAIRTFAYAAENAERKIDAARAGMQALDRQVDAVPDEERDEKMEELKTKAQSIAKDAKAAIDSLHKAGDVCAAELRAALRLEAVKSNGKGDNIGELHKLNDDDIDRINDELKHMDFREVSQGEIGDCYLVATLMAMMRTPEGRKLLQKSIRPHTVNGTRTVTSSPSTRTRTTLSAHARSSSREPTCAEPMEAVRASSRFSRQPTDRCTRAALAATVFSAPPESARANLRPSWKKSQERTRLL